MNCVRVCADSHPVIWLCAYLRCADFHWCVILNVVLEISSRAHGMDGIFHFSAKGRGVHGFRIKLHFYCVVFVSDLNTQNHHLKSNGCGALYRGPNYQLYGEFAASLGAPSGPLQLEEHWAVA